MAVSTPTTPGQILTSAYVNNNINSGLQYVKEQTIGSAVSSVSVTSAFSTTYDNYKIIVSGGVASTNQDLLLQFTGSSADYYQGQIILAYNTNTVTGSGQTAGSSFFVGFGSTSVLNANVDIQGPFFAKPTSISCARPIQLTSGSSVFVSGFHNVATSYTGFTISSSTGTMTGGTISVYGYRKA